eukprot:SAG22_NODE_10700_length_520_cov_0.983373_1_plen_99_part_00
MPPFPSNCVAHHGAECVGVLMQPLCTAPLKLNGNWQVQLVEDPPAPLPAFIKCPGRGRGQDGRQFEAKTQTGGWWWGGRGWLMVPQVAVWTGGGGRRL